MDYTNVIVAVITGIFAVIGNWLIARKNHEQDVKGRAEFDTRTSVRLQSIEKKLDEHNGYAKKFGEIQTDIAVIKNEIKNIKEDVDK